MANIRDVAEKAKVAKCTVSRVLNGSDKVSEKTKKKVLDVIEELDYTPNELARGMFKQQSGIIAMLVPSIRHPFFSSLASEFEVELYKKGLKLMLCSTKGSIKKEAEYLKMFKSNLVDGIILGVSNLEKEVYEKLQKPIVLLDQHINEDIPIVVSNHRQGGALAAQCFIDSGCKHVIHLISSGSKSVYSYQSHEALTSILEEHGILVEPVNIKWNLFEFEAYYKSAKEILDNDQSIDGIMAPDVPAAAFLKAAINLGKKVPEEFNVVAYDGTYVSEMSLIKMTTIVQPLKRIAEEATNYLLKMKNDIPIEKNFIELEVTMELGETTNH